MSRSVLLVSAIYFLSLLQQREQEEEEEEADHHCCPPIPHTIFVSKMAGSSSGRKAGVANYTHDELDSLIGMILERVPISNDEWDTIVVDHAKAWPFFRTRNSIKTKYAAIKRIKSSTGNPNMPDYVLKARQAHVLIGRRANLGTGEEDFDLIEGYVKSEDVDGLETNTADILAEVVEESRIVMIAGEEGDEEDNTEKPNKNATEKPKAPAPTVAKEETPVGVAASSVLTPSLVLRTTPIPQKRAYQQKKSSVPDAAAFTQFIVSHDKREERRDQRSIEMWSGVKDVAEKFLGAAVTMMNTWQQQQQQQSYYYHGPPPYHHQHGPRPPPTAPVSTGGSSTADTYATPKPPPRKRQRDESHGESHGQDEETGIL